MGLRIGQYGVAPERLFRSETEIYRFEEPCQIIACSDGLFEAAGWNAAESGVRLLAEQSAQTANQISDKTRVLRQRVTAASKAVEANCSGYWRTVAASSVAHRARAWRWRSRANTANMVRVTE